MTVSTDQRLTAGGGAGATPAAGAAAASPPAWHPDPVGRFPLRYWDGAQWTANVVNAERQVGIDRGWAEAMAAAGARSAPSSSAPVGQGPAAQTTATPTPSGASAPTTAPTPDPRPAPTSSAAPDAPVPPAGAPLGLIPPAASAAPAAPTGPDGPMAPAGAPLGMTPQPAATEVERTGKAVVDTRSVEEQPVERFDISPAAVMGPRAPVHRGSEPEATPTPAVHPAADHAPGGAAGPSPARRWGRSRESAGAGTPPQAPPPADGADAGTSVLTRIGGVKVLAVAGVALVVLVVGLGLAWASAARSYDAQEAWQRRAEQWEERAGDHANERDEAIARIGRSRGRNRELNEENAEQQRQIEDLAADNAALTDENRLLNDALNSLGYELAP
ncbi:MAG: DUF2510 domain-containing protein [Acidimicrobiales bacterium]|nr:DUF2510 domain-containing protein [Acidimicrobiales bacterium]